MFLRQIFQTFMVCTPSFHGSKRDIEYRYIRLSHLQHFVQSSFASYKTNPYMQKARKNIKYNEYRIGKSKQTAVMLVQIFFSNKENLVRVTCAAQHNGAVTGNKIDTNGIITVQNSGWKTSRMLYDRGYFPKQKGNNKDVC